MKLRFFLELEEIDAFELRVAIVFNNKLLSNRRLPYGK